MLDANNVRIDDVEITKEDIERTIRSIAYRKAYNQKPEVVVKRRLYNQRRVMVMRKVKEMLKEKGDLV